MHFGGHFMYRMPETQQLTFDKFFLPFGGKLCRDNRWVRLADVIPWAEFESAYANTLAGSHTGCPAKPVRVALGALIIKERLGTSDRETVAQIQENPYLQYFLGFHEFTETLPFDPSLFVQFRKRLGVEFMTQVNDRICAIAGVPQSSVATPPSPKPSFPESSSEASQASSDTSAPTELGPSDSSNDSPNAASEIPASPCPTEQGTGSCVSGPILPSKTVDTLSSEKQETETSSASTSSETSSANRGKLIMDATCSPADIAYPTDLNLLNNAREQAEQLIDVLYAPLQGQLTKPRTYRRKARKAYLANAKARRLSKAKIRKAIGEQLRFLRRDLRHIDDLLTYDAVSLELLSSRQYRMLLIVQEVARQQQEMYQQRSCRIEGRIVSLSQPHFRPIVRDKAKAPTEFGAKLSVSVIHGFVFLDRLDWENFNESTRLIEQVEDYKNRFGFYPASVHADQIYRTRENRAYCKKRGIRLSGPPLGRRPKKTEENCAELEAQKRLARQDERDRNIVEGKFGQAKRRFSLGRVMTKLAETSACAIAVTLLVVNLGKWLHTHFFALFCLIIFTLRSAQNVVSRVSKSKNYSGFVSPFLSASVFQPMVQYGSRKIWPREAIF
jgi:transposase, IS5 family